MATFAGKEGIVKIGANAIAEVRDWAIDESGETADDSSMGDTARTHLATMTSWTGSVSCWWDDTDTNGQDSLAVGDSVTLNVYPEGDTVGDNEYSGTATVTGISRRAALDGVVEAEFTFQGNGALAKGTA